MTRDTLRVNIVTLFPEVFAPWLEVSIIGKAVEKGLVTFRLVQLRDFTHDRHNTVDDYPSTGTIRSMTTPTGAAPAWC